MDTKMFFEGLLSYLKEYSGNNIVLYSEESAFRKCRSLTNRGVKILPDFLEKGRLIKYKKGTFYLSTKARKRYKVKRKHSNTLNKPKKNDFQNFLENTYLKLSIINDNGKRCKINLLKTIKLSTYASIYLNENDVLWQCESEYPKDQDTENVFNELSLYLLECFDLPIKSKPRRAYWRFTNRIKERKYCHKSMITGYCKERKMLLLNLLSKMRGSCTEELESLQFQSFPVLYGTNRKKKNQKKDDNILFGEERDKNLNLGISFISIPRKHCQGELERPSWFRERIFGESPEKDFTILKNEVVCVDRFVELLKQQFAESGENDVLLFIHGFNTSFEDSLYRTAQLGYDLCFKGAVNAFSWPSRGNVLDYVSDEQSADYSVPFLSDYIKLMLNSSTIGKLHIIAHSMGSVVLCGALKKLKEEGIYPSTVINQIILAAPDIDREVFFMQIMPAIKTTPNITLYACDKDNALKFSKLLRSGYVRLGEGGENLLITDGLDSVDATEVEMSTLGHTYFAQTPSLLNEIHMVLENLPPCKRMLKECINLKKQKYWALKRT